MICDGSDEAEALEDLRQVIQEGLGELQQMGREKILFPAFVVPVKHMLDRKTFFC